MCAENNDNDNNNDNFIKNATNVHNKSKTTQNWKDTKYKIGKNTMTNTEII